MGFHSMARHLLELILMTGLLQSSNALSQGSSELAPAFSLQSVSGETHELAQYRGSYVVLEWMNFRCRIVDGLYKSGTLPALQAELKEKEVIWLSIVSDAQGKQGQVSPEKMMRQIEKRKGNHHAVLLDLVGLVGKMYEAEVSPYMVLVDPEGMIAYQGALDNQPEGEAPEDQPAVNYVSEALKQAMNGEEIEYPVTEAYGCPIRYDR